MNYLRTIGGIMALSLVMCGLLAGCSKEQSLSQETLEPGPAQALYIQGDIQDWLDLSVIWSSLDHQSLEAYDTEVSGVLLEDLLEASGPIYEENDLYLIADDGFMVRLDGSTIEGTHIAYVDGLGWCYLSSKHPVNSGIKHIGRLVVVAKNGDALTYGERGLGFNLIVDGENTWLTRGQLLMMNDRRLNLSDGQSTLGDISIEVMKQHTCLSLSNFMADEDTLLLMTQDGNQVYIYENKGYLEVSETFLTYYSEEGDQAYYQVLGGIINPSPISNRDNYYDAEHYLTKGVPVMTIFLDGLSYDQYLYFKQASPKAYLSNLDQVKEALTVYKPVTNAGFAAMITGQLPKVSGIHDRSDREPQVKTVFDLAEDLNMTHALVEGDIGILSLKTDTLLNLDGNNNGLTDDEIMVSALEAVNEGYGYLMVHFHSIDDLGHDKGPYGEATMAQIQVVDGYVEKLVELWDGVVIITSDHGMHQEGEAGDHGYVIAQDIRVPYTIIDQRLR